MARRPGRRPRLMRFAGPEATSAGRRHPDRATVGRRVDRRGELREAAPDEDVRGRLRRRAGHDAEGAGAELLPLHHQRRAVDGRPRQLCLRDQGLQEGRDHRRLAVRRRAAQQLATQPQAERDVWWRECGVEAERSLLIAVALVIVVVLLFLASVRAAIIQHRADVGRAARAAVRAVGWP